MPLQLSFVFNSFAPRVSRAGNSLHTSAAAKKPKGVRTGVEKNLFALTQQRPAQAQRGKLERKVKTMQAKMMCREGKKQPLLFNAAVRVLKILFNFYLILCAMERGTQ